MNIRNLFKKPEYELDILFCNTAFLDDRFQSLQNDGWEIAGLISTMNATNGSHQYATLPLKRKKKWKLKSKKTE